MDIRSKITPKGIKIDQGIIAGCAGGTFENILEAADILSGQGVGPEFSLSVYPQSQPVMKALSDGGILSELISKGAVIKPAFCGPCFGAGDTPSNGALSVRHTTRNFENREGSRLVEGQLSYVALMDSRHIAATAANGGYLAKATDREYKKRVKKYVFDSSIYENKVYIGEGKPDNEAQIIYGPNIADWPEQIPLSESVLIKVVSVLTDDVTTTDELIPSGETSSYRSNPLRLAQFTLSRKDPTYVPLAKEFKEKETIRRETGIIPQDVLDDIGIELPQGTILGSCVVAKKPGDGSAREQAASCQRVLGGIANIAVEYATKRYRSNLINWGMLPLLSPIKDYKVGDYILLEDVLTAVREGSAIKAKLLRDKKTTPVTFTMGDMTEDEKKIIISGCLINFNKKN